MNAHSFKIAVVTLTVIATPILVAYADATESVSPGSGDTITLISDQSHVPVIVHSNEKDKNGTLVVEEAATDLQRYIELVTGRTLPFGEERPDATCIHIGQTRYVKAMRLGLEHLDYDGFIICTRFRGNVPQLIIAGRTPVGTSSGVNYFLRRYVGVQWLFPGELGEIVPKRTNIAIPAELDDKQEPDYLQREHWVAGQPKAWGAFEARSLMRSAFPRTVVGHSIPEAIHPDMYGEHPEYFPLIDGKRFKPRRINAGWQPCHSNPEVVKLFIEAARKYFDKSPDHLCFSLAENDGGGYCQCDNCKAMDYPNAKKWATDLCRNHADRSWNFYAQIAREIERTHPDRYLGVYSYLWSNEPPSDPDFQMPANFVVQKTFPHESDIERFERWSKLGVAFGEHDYIYDTFFHAFRHYPHQLAHEIRFRYRRGMRSSGFESYSRASKCAPKLWILARLLWDIRENVDNLMTEYCQHAYGAAAAPMLQFWNKWEEIYNRQDERARRVFFTCGYPEELQLRTITRDDLKYHSQRILRAAQTADTRNDKKRVQMVADEYDHSRAFIQVILDIRQAYDKLKNGDGRESLQAQMIQLTNVSKYLEDVWPPGRIPEVGNFGHLGLVTAWKRTQIPSDLERCQDDLAQAITERQTASSSHEQIVAYWTDVSRDNPRLARYAESQIYCLNRRKRQNLIKNPLFTTDQAELRDWSAAKEDHKLAVYLKPSRLETDLIEKGAQGIIGFNGFLWIDRVYQDVPVEPGKRYSARISVLNRVNNEARMAWSDHAVATLKVTSDQEVRKVQTRRRTDGWQDIRLTITAPQACQTARFEIYVENYLDGEEVRFARPVFECISE